MRLIGVLLCLSLFGESIVHGNTAKVRGRLGSRAEEEPYPSLLERLDRAERGTAGERQLAARMTGNLLDAVSDEELNRALVGALRGSGAPARLALALVSFLGVRAAEPSVRLSGCRAALLQRLADGRHAEATAEALAAIALGRDLTFQPWAATFSEEEAAALRTLAAAATPAVASWLVVVLAYERPEDDEVTALLERAYDAWHVPAEPSLVPFAKRMVLGATRLRTARVCARRKRVFVRAMGHRILALTDLADDACFLDIAGSLFGQ